MIVFRLSISKYVKNLTGKGAEKSGGRWNSKGIAIIYTSQSHALCTTEIAVHTPFENIPLGYHIITIEIPDSILIKALSKKKIHKNYRVFHMRIVLNSQAIKLLGKKKILL